MWDWSLQSVKAGQGGGGLQSVLQVPSGFRVNQSWNYVLVGMSEEK